MRPRRIATTFIILTALTTLAKAAPVNLTGSWQPKYWSVKMSLHQDGDRVWGYGGAPDFWFRGQWDGPRLILVATNFDPKRPKGVCKSRGVFAVSGTTLTNLTTTWWDEGRPKPHRGPWVRLSPSAGDAIPYPYAAELTQCGSLRTYELVFASGSDRLQGSDWPILSAVADTLKQNAGMKIQIAGHTDSVGNAKSNLELSDRRAAAVKITLVEKYAADAGRITTKGWGADQPVGENTTEDGKALNRRVEIVLN